MKFTNQGAALYIPDGAAEETALCRTTHLCISAHQDDIEFMAYPGIAECFMKPNEWFSGIVVTDGAGSPRSGRFQQFTDEEMKAVRMREQNAAAAVGGYSLVAQLHYTSSAVKNAKNNAPVEELKQLLLAMRPKTVYTHNPADRHATHTAVCLRVIAALRAVREQYFPQALYGMEMWRSLDWLSQPDKITLDASAYPNVAADLAACFSSQIAGGKRYDAAILGRRAANATFGESHAVDAVSAAAYGMDMTELIFSDELPEAFLKKRIARFQEEALGLLKSVSE